MITVGVRLALTDEEALALLGLLDSLQELDPQLKSVRNELRVELGGRPAVREVH